MPKGMRVQVPPRALLFLPIEKAVSKAPREIFRTSERVFRPTSASPGKNHNTKFDVVVVGDLSFS